MNRDKNAIARLRELASLNGLRITHEGEYIALFDKGAPLSGPLNPHSLTLQDLEDTLKHWGVLHTVFWTDRSGTVHNARMDVDLDGLDEEQRSLRERARK